MEEELLRELLIKKELEVVRLQSRLTSATQNMNSAFDEADELRTELRKAHELLEWALHGANSTRLPDRP